MWTFNSLTGRIDRNGVSAGLGYSGDHDHFNKPSSENIPDVGPIPRGEYSIGDFFDDPGSKGPEVAHLTPKEGTNVFGRAGFMIHGDNAHANQSASHGCIVTDRFVREMINRSGDKDLRVISEAA